MEMGGRAGDGKDDGESDRMHERRYIPDTSLRFLVSRMQRASQHRGAGQPEWAALKPSCRLRCRPRVRVPICRRWDVVSVDYPWLIARGEAARGEGSVGGNGRMVIFPHGRRAPCVRLSIDRDVWYG